MAEVLQIKLLIKEWEREFATKNGRKPAKADVKADAEISKAYKAYNEIKRGTKGSDKPSKKEDKRAKSKPSDPPSQNSKDQNLDKVPADDQQKQPLHVPSIDIQLTDDEEFAPAMPVFNAELGPTPQANGKVLSIFDLILSPPESSPIKPQIKGVRVPPSVMPASPFKTPTRAVKRIDLGDITPSRGPSLSEKLRMASSPFKSGSTQQNESKTESNLESGDSDIMATPNYLGKVNNKFSFHETASPLKNSSPNHSIFQTPTKPAAEPFQVSPSPLKSQRFLSKKLSDIFYSQQSLVNDDAFTAQKLEFEKEFEEVAETNEETVTEEDPINVKKRKKATTQKRTTRNWKIKPRQEGDVGESFEGKDVHEEIQRIESRDRQQLEEYLHGKESGDDSDGSGDEHEVFVRKDPPSTKLNPVSNNFQRLKINDPRAKKFKQRMKRR